MKSIVVVIPFPFSDLSDFKKRPALVLCDLPGDDIILCQITSRNVKDSMSNPLYTSDFINGFLLQNGNIRPNRIFTADKGLILRSMGIINQEKLKDVINKITELISI